MKYIVAAILLSLSPCVHALMVAPSAGQQPPKLEEVKAAVHANRPLVSTPAGEAPRTAARAEVTAGGPTGGGAADEILAMRNSPRVAGDRVEAIAAKAADENGPSLAPVWGLAIFALFAAVVSGVLLYYSKKVNRERKASGARNSLDGFY